MSEFKHGDVVVHLGGRLGVYSRNRGLVLTVLDGPVKIEGHTGMRYIVDRPLYINEHDKPTAYHANAKYLLKLRYAKELGIV